MSIPLQVKRTGFHEELIVARRKDFFDLKSKKFLPTIDNLYFSIFLNDDKNGNVRLEQLFERLEENKQEVIRTHTPVPFYFGLKSVDSNLDSSAEEAILDTTLKSYSLYRFCLTEQDLYDVFIAQTLPNEDTPRIVVQLRAYGLWTRPHEELLTGAYKKVEALFARYGCTFKKCRESRIDFCYHTNAITSPNSIFMENRYGEVKHLHTNLSRATQTAKVEQTETGTKFYKDYMCFGEKKSNNVRVRFYDKVKEIIELGYKGFFFQIWYDNGLISYYDKWCFEYALPFKNVRYLDKARLAFYVAHGTDPARVRQYETALADEKKPLAHFTKLADEFMPKTTLVMNIEYETKRKFYYYSDKFIETFKFKKREIPHPLNRLYQILDNRRVFLEYLTRKTLSFHKGKDENGNYIYCAWWKRLRNVKLDGLKVDAALMRYYSHEMDKKMVQRKIVNGLASVSVYDNKVETDFVTDLSDFLADINDNEAHKMGRLLFVTEDGRVLDELHSALTVDYSYIKARKNIYLKNRKKPEEQALQESIAKELAEKV